MLGLALALLLMQSLPPDTKVALVLGPEPTRVEIVTLAQAEREYQELSKQLKLTAEQQHRRAALIDSLGTLPSPAPKVRLASWDLERERWQRQPAQRPIP